MHTARQRLAKKKQEKDDAVWADLITWVEEFEQVHTATDLSRQEFEKKTHKLQIKLNELKDNLPRYVHISLKEECERDVNGFQTFLDDVKSNPSQPFRTNIDTNGTKQPTVCIDPKTVPRKKGKRPRYKTSAQRSADQQVEGFVKILGSQIPHQFKISLSKDNHEKLKGMCHDMLKRKGLLQ